MAQADRKDNVEPFVFPVKSPYKPENADIVLNGYADFLTQDPASSWVETLRQQGKARVEEFGIPSPKLERWKYTNLFPIEKERFKVQLPAILNPSIPDKLDGIESRLTIVNGIFQPQLSDMPEGLYCGSLKSFIESNDDWLRPYLESQDERVRQFDDQMLMDLNAAYMSDGIVIHVPKNVHIENTIEILSVLAGPVSSHPAILIVVEDGASLTLCERVIGDFGWQNRVNRVHVGSNARLNIFRTQTLSDKAYFTENTVVVQGRDSYLQMLTMTTGAALSRNQYHAFLKGENGECHIDGTYTITDKQHHDTTILIEHMEPHCYSNQTHKGLLAKNARGVFQGKIHVHQKAQKTDGYQLNNTILLSDTAEMDTKPELEIYADDVKCSHGATTGQLDDGPLFYMRSRGIPESVARKIMMQSFLGEVVDKIVDENMKSYCEQILDTWLDNVDKS